MAFYLGRAFRDTHAVHVLHDLHIEDPAQPEFNGKPGRCQIDHLVLHTRGAFIIESKSVAGHVTIASDGTGGDVWTRSYLGRTTGFPSPIQQAARQAEFLRRFLQRNRAPLLGKLGLGMGLITKVLVGTDQRGFTNMPLQVIVAISDNGAIEFSRGWHPPTEPFRVFVTKADQVTHKINDERTRHAAADGVLRQTDGEYGFWSMNGAEVARVAAFLHQSHTPTRVQV